MYLDQSQITRFKKKIRIHIDILQLYQCLRRILHDTVCHQNRSVPLFSEGRASCSNRLCRTMLPWRGLAFVVLSCTSCCSAGVTSWLLVNPKSIKLCICFLIDSNKQKYVKSRKYLYLHILIVNDNLLSMKCFYTSVTFFCLIIGTIVCYWLPYLGAVNCQLSSSKYDRSANLYILSIYSEFFQSDVKICQVTTMDLQVTAEAGRNSGIPYTGAPVSTLNTIYKVLRPP